MTAIHGNLVKTAVYTYYSPRLTLKSVFWQTIPRLFKLHNYAAVQKPSCHLFYLISLPPSLEAETPYC